MSTQSTIVLLGTRAVAAVLLIAASVAASSVYLTHYRNRFTLDDDYVWLYLTGTRIGRVNEVDVLLDRVLDKLKRAGAVQDLAKAELLRSYMDNYLLPSVLYSVGSAVTRVAEPEVVDQYPRYMARSMGRGFHIAFGVMLALAMVTVAWGATRQSIAVVALAVVGMALSEAMSPGMGQYLVRQETFAGLAEHVARLFVNPSFNFSPFGFTPRSHFTLLLVPLFLLRMRGQYGASYALVVLLSFVHQTYAGLVLGLVVCLDLVLRPAVLWQRAVWLPTCVATLLFLMRERVWHIIGAPVFAIFAGLAIAAVTVMVLAQTRSIRTRLTESGNWWGKGTAPGWGTDALLVTELWGISVPVSYFLARTTSEHQSLYLWSQLSGRSLAMIRPMLFLAAAAAIVSLLKTQKSIYPLTAVAVVCAWSAYYVAQRIPDDPRGVVNDLSSGLHEMDRDLLAPGSSPARSERMIYYAVSKSVETGHDATTPLLR